MKIKKYLTLAVMALSILYCFSSFATYENNDSDTTNYSAEPAPCVHCESTGHISSNCPSNNDDDSDSDNDDEYVTVNSAHARYLSSHPWLYFYAGDDSDSE